MKAFIQSRKTKRFYAGSGLWTDSREQAMNCGNSLRAERIAREEKLEEVSLVLSFDQGRQTLVVPMKTTASRDASKTPPDDRNPPRT